MDLLILLGGIWAIGALIVAISCLVLYAEANNDRKRWPTLYSEAETERKKRTYSRRFFTAYAWPVWSFKWLLRAVANMQATAFGPQDKDAS